MSLFPMGTGKVKSITIIADDTDSMYADELERLFRNASVEVYRTVPSENPPSVEAIGTPDHIFHGSDYAVLILSNAMWEQIYSVRGYRATLDAISKANSPNFFLVLTENIWIPGFLSTQVFIDLQARNAVPIAAEIFFFMGIEPAKVEYEPPEFPHIARPGPSTKIISDYLADLCVLSDHAGVIAFGAVVYEKGQKEVERLLTSDELVAAVDLAAGPHLDMFAIGDTTTVNELDGESNEPNMSAASVFLSQFLGRMDVQLHYPSLMLFLVDGQKFTHAASVPLIYLEPDSFPQRLEALAGTVSRALRLWRLRPDFGVSDVWAHLVKTLKGESYAVEEYETPIETGPAIEWLASSITYF